jgi:MFS transporter, PAT family, solute carrier family 33 (acetyl-CoA transportor), member 1
MQPSRPMGSAFDAMHPVTSLRSQSNPDSKSTMQRTSRIGTLPCPARCGWGVSRRLPHTKTYVYTVCLPGPCLQRRVLQGSDSLRKRAGRREDDGRSVLLDDGATTVNGAAPVGEQPSLVDASAALPEPEPNPWNDVWGISLLLLLYTLQGIPMGLASAVPVLLQGQGLGFSAKATFSFATWPYSLKLLWSPIVDSVFSERFGRRKSWVVPVQLLTGAVMVFLSMHIDDQFRPGAVPDVMGLTVTFFALYALVATQDIAVDGWALTMLRHENVGYASVCNSVGQSAGWIIAYALLLALGDAQFCDDFLRSVDHRTGQPLVTIGGFMMFWGVMFLVVTIGLAVFKHEEPEVVAPSSRQDHSCGAAASAVGETYLAAWKVIMLPTILQLVPILLTSRLAFSGIESALDIELLQKGVPKRMLLLIGVTLTPLEMLFSVLAASWTAGSRPFELWGRVYPFRIITELCMIALLACATNSIPGTEPELSWGWYGSVISLFVLIRFAANLMFVSQMAFYNQVSDRSIGGTYMTLLNTLTNLGRMWPAPLALWTIDWIEQRGCYVPSEAQLAVASLSSSPVDPHTMSISGLRPVPLGFHPNSTAPLLCSTAEGYQVCTALGGACREQHDGFTLVALACATLGIGWVLFTYPRIIALQDFPRAAWQIVKPTSVDAKKPAVAHHHHHPHHRGNSRLKH